MIQSLIGSKAFKLYEVINKIYYETLESLEPNYFNSSNYRFTNDPVKYLPIFKELLQLTLIITNNDKLLEGMIKGTRVNLMALVKKIEQGEYERI